MNARALSQYEALAAGVDTKSPSAVMPTGMAKRVLSATHGQPLISETAAPAFEVTAKYLFQSYFDDTLGARALLQQSPGEPIVQSTYGTQQVTGYAVGLHPSSEAPVSIRFFTGGQQGASAAYRLTPGQLIRPHGRPGEASGAFSGFEFGLPFGWLGGGSVMLVVLRTPDANVCWNSAPEMIFHRLRLQIVDPAAIPVSTAISQNWPHRFPWPGAVGPNNVAQAGQPALVVTPTKTALRLRAATTAAAVTMRALLYGTNDFDLGEDGLIDTTTESGYQDISWGLDATLAGSIGVGTAQYPTQIFGDSQLTRFSSDEGGGVVLVDASGGDLTGTYVDICRYGRL